MQKYLGAVSVVLEDAKKNEILQKNPAKMISLPIIQKKEQKIPSLEEMKFLLDVILIDQEPYRTFNLMAFYLGLRRGELCALRWSDLRNGILYVSRSRGYVKGLGIVEGSTKNKKTRLIPLDDFMNMQFQNLFDRCIFEIGKFGTKDYIFVDEYGLPPHPDQFSNHFRKRLDKYKISRAYHLHTLRHFYASYLLQNNMSKQVTADLLGHGDTSFLEKTYCHPSMEFKQKAPKLMASLIGAPTERNIYV